MVQFIEGRAREMGLETLFALSTQAFNFFRAKGGFAEGTPDDLPPARRLRYDQSGRRSKVLVYGDLPHDRGTPPDVDAIAWREEIQTALAALPAAQREAFLLRHIEGLEYEEMGRITGAGVSALKMRVKRACEFLRLRLAEVERA